MNFCEILKELREEKGLTQKEVAYGCKLTPTCICQLENGTRNPTGSTIRALATFFNCSADYLLQLDDGDNRKAPSKSEDLSETSDKLTADAFKLFKVMSEVQKAQTFGYIVALLEQSNKDVDKILKSE